MGKSPFPRASSFGQQPEPKDPSPRPTPGAEDIALSPTQKLARQQLRDGDSKTDLERWYQMVNEWCHSDTRRLSSASFASVPLEQIEELRDELYSRLR